ncbi:uroporphyrinogen decarboxylase [Polynucleobacter kasalickyi]|uniref:Uroporphyrinogen decarboxylase n=1 Tax=Polynucleobacter kasalickyi TaxID=1938817 RepID=A0A1W2BSY0_9BURK|nr:uroporphyrinogen decarboxylase [Polynucleobacter kasalickyi]SMC76053.1 uroporphyrinogen decarboxylase [Polynucleobacter kasalickyi]
MENYQSQFINDSFLRACFLKPVESTPVWLMRQAGRYLPEYNKTRAKAGSFLQLAKNPGFCSEVTLQPLDRYPLDAAILFSDILTIPDAMGLGLSFEQGEGPRFSNPLQSEKSILDLQEADMDQLKYVFDAVSLIRKDLMQNGKQRVPLIGFSGSPWTLACYMVDGGGSKEFLQTKTLLFKRPDLLQRILDINIASVTKYLELQVEAGAQALMLFDTWGGMLANGDYQKFSLEPMKEIIKRLKQNTHINQNVPILLFTKGGGVWIDDLADSNANVLGLDWTVSIGNIKNQILAKKSQVALQGNLDPMVLMGSHNIIQQKAAGILKDLSTTAPYSSELSPLDGHIFNLGHGISQFTPPENVTCLIDTIKTESKKLRLAKI